MTTETETRTDCVVKQIARMLTVATPIVIVDSHDHPDTLLRLRGMLAKTGRPVVSWNLADGFQAISDSGAGAIAVLSDTETKIAAQGVHGAVHVALKFPERTVVIVDNLHWSWEKPAVLQALQNVREPFKASKRCVIGLTLGGNLPADLLQHVSYLADPLPDETALADKVSRVYRSAHENDLDGAEALEVARELRGTSPFRAEQLAAQSLTKTGIDRDRVRDNARKQIDDTAGLSVETGRETFDDIGGLDAIRGFLTRYFAGPRRPSVVVRIEEIEKALAGFDGDSSGTSADIMGTLLTAFEDYRWTGILAYGVSGCGKSLVAKAAANQFGAKAIKFEPNACKAGLVGQTGSQIRAACEVLHAIGGDRVFFVASMNKIASLPPELRRRFAAGTWYFDVPSKAGRADIWRITADRFAVDYDGYDADNLTGADIRDIVQRSFELSCTTTEAAAFHVPLCKAAPDAIADSRRDAAGRYLDATNGGPYRDPSNTETTYDRSIDLEG